MFVREALGVLFRSIHRGIDLMDVFRGESTGKCTPAVIQNRPGRLRPQPRELRFASDANRTKSGAMLLFRRLLAVVRLELDHALESQRATQVGQLAGVKTAMKHQPSDQAP